MVLKVVWHGPTSAQKPGKPPRPLTQSPVELPTPWMFGAVAPKEPLGQRPGFECTHAWRGVPLHFRTANMSCICGNVVSGGGPGGGGPGGGGGGGGGGGDGPGGGEGAGPGVGAPVLRQQRSRVSLSCPPIPSPPPLFCNTQSDDPVRGSVSVTKPQVGGWLYIDMSCMMYPVQPASAEHSLAQSTCDVGQVSGWEWELSSHSQFWQRPPPAHVQ